MDVEALLGVFYEEARERLDELEKGILQLENVPEDRETLDAVFRAAHNLKGSSGLAGITPLSDLAHVMEDIFDQAREGQAPITAEDFSLLLRAVDVLRELVERHQAGQRDSLPEEYGPVMEKLRARAQNVQPKPLRPQNHPANEQGRTRLRISMSFRPDFFATGQDPLFLLLELATLGQLNEVQCHADKLPKLADLDPETLYLSWTVVLETNSQPAEVENVFLFARYDGKIQIEELESSSPADAESWPDRQMKEALVKSDGEKGSCPQRPGAPNGSVPHGSRQNRMATIRVRAERVDRVIDLVADLTIQLGRLELAVQQSGLSLHSPLARRVEWVQRLVAELQRDALRLRMVPVEENFTKFTRLVRDTAQKLGKEVSFVIEGGDTELDRQLLENLSDPVKHLLRNAVDHGIEPPEERLRHGKRVPGRIWLRTYERSGRVFVEVQDDGRGLDLEAIRAKARQMGHGSLADTLDPAELLKVISQPGFTTAGQVSEISGRGVGLDVVFNAVQQLGGHLSLHTKQGMGTTFRISLPLTRVIMEALIFRVGGQTYLVPATSVLETLPWSGAKVSSFDGIKVIHHRGSFFPVLDLHELIASPELPSEETKIGLLVHGESLDFILLVAEVIESRQVIVKSFEGKWRRLPGLTGATVLGDGTIGFILDLVAIEKMLLSKQSGRAQGETAQVENVDGGF